MVDLRVDLDGLTLLGSTLSSITSGLDATRRLIDGVRSDLGSGDLWDALDDFESHWDDGRGQIEKNMTAMTGILDDVVRTYSTGDEQLATDLRKESSGEGGS